MKRIGRFFKENITFLLVIFLFVLLEEIIIKWCNINDDPNLFLVYYICLPVIFWISYDSMKGIFKRRR